MALLKAHLPGIPSFLRPDHPASAASLNSSAVSRIQEYEVL